MSVDLYASRWNFFVKQEKHFLQAVILVSRQSVICWVELQVGHMLG